MRPRRAILCLALYGFPLAATSAPARPANPPASAPALDPGRRALFVSEQRASVVEMLKEAPEIAPMPPASLVRLELRNRHLVARILDDALPDDVAMQMAGGNGVVRLVQTLVATDPPQKFFRFGLTRFDERSLRTLHVELYPIPGRMNVVVTVETPLLTTKAELMEQSFGLGFADDGDEPNARLMLDQNADDDASVDGTELPVGAHAAVTGGSFADLVEAHHDEALALLGEGLATLRSMPVLAGVNEAEARAAFIPTQPDAETTRGIQSVLAALRRDGSAAVPAQHARLRGMGARAAVALAHLPRGDWSPDLALNVDTVLSGLLSISSPRAEALLASPTRVVDLLYAEDAALRRAALARLEAMANAKLDLDVSADPYTVADRIEAIRARLAR